MSVWDLYEDRMSVKGNTRRQSAYNKEVRYLNTKLKETLSYFTVTIDDIEQEVAIINSDNLNEKTIFSLPEEDIKLGGLVYWENNYWLITEKDANDVVYTRAKMIQCNHLLKWVSSDGVIHEQWCVVEDGTKYLTGEYEDRNFIVTRGDTRLQMMISKNEDTVLFTRESRFLIDDEDAPNKICYILTKPLRTGWVYRGEGIYKFILQEVVSTEYDNHELGIADYYRYYPKDGEESSSSDTASDINEGRWL